MNLLILAGLVKPPSRDKIGDEGFAALIVAAELALECGMLVTPEWLSGCCEYEKEALRIAKNRLSAKQASYIGIATHSLRGAATLTGDPKATQAIDDAEKLARNSQVAGDMAAAMNSESMESVLTRLPNGVAK